jgi:hypothetical protein
VEYFVACNLLIINAIVVESTGVELFRVLITRNLLTPGIATTGPLPFSANILGLDVVVEKVDTTQSGIVAICRRDKIRPKIEILDLPLPMPAPVGAKWIAAYRHWRRGF